MARKDKISLSTLALAKDYTDTHGGGGGGGTSNYNDLSHKPKINNIELEGNKSLNDLGIQEKLTIDTALSKTSSNPVQNQTIALPIEQLQGSMATAKSNIDLLSGSQDALRIAIRDLDLLVASKVDKVAGKGLSTNDFTDALKDKVVDLPPIKLIGSGLNLDNDGKLSTTGTVAVDSALSNTSENPVQNKVITLTIEQLQGSLADKADTSDLGDLAFIDKDGVSSTKYLKGDGTWDTPSQGGHQMIPTTNDIATIAALSDGDDDLVINAYSAKRWSNTDCITLLTTVLQGNDTMGTWEDDSVWETSGVRTGWLCHEALAGVLSDDDVEFSLVFDPANSETVSAYAYRIDDNYTITQDGVTKTVGGVAIKFNNAIQSASVKVGVKLKRSRTQTINVVRS